MMDIFKAVDKVGENTEFCKTRNIWDILDRLDISYDTKDLGSPQTGLKGYCTSFFGNYFIMVNRHLASHLQALVAWHELGHIILDPDLLTEGSCLFDSTFCNEATDAELRANIFAAEGMIEDDDIIELIRNGYTRNAAASQLMVPIPFLDYKIRILREYDTPLNYVDLPDTFCLGEDITDSREQW